MVFLEGLKVDRDILLGIIRDQKQVEPSRGLIARDLNLSADLIVIDIPVYVYAEARLIVLVRDK